MKVVVEITGTIEGDSQSALDRTEMEHIFDALAEAIVAYNEFEADVAVNYETGQVDLFLVVEAPDLPAAVRRADDVVSRAFKAADLVDLQRDEAHARRAELIPA